jgi:hypothetical protein
MTDLKLHTLTEKQLRALYSSAPGYLTFLLDKKRVLERGTVWEMSIPQRAAKTQSNQETKVPARPFWGRLPGKNLTDQELRIVTEKQLRTMYGSAPASLTFLLDRKRTLEQGIAWEMSIPQRAASSAR